MLCFLFSLPTFPSFYDLKMNFSFYISSSLLRMGTINFARSTTKSCYRDMTHIKSVNYPNMECRSPLKDNLKISNAIFRDCKIKWRARILPSNELRNSIFESQKVLVKVHIIFSIKMVIVHDILVFDRAFPVNISVFKYWK